MSIGKQGVTRRGGWALASLLVLSGPALAAPRSGPVNPAVQVTTYKCRDGQTIVAGYPDRETAIVTYKDHAYPLKLAPAAGGARYIGYGLQWWVKGDHAALATLAPGATVASGPSLDCTAAADRGETKI